MFRLALIALAAAALLAPGRAGAQPVGARECIAEGAASHAQAYRACRPRVARAATRDAIEREVRAARSEVARALAVALLARIDDPLRADDLDAAAPSQWRGAYAASPALALERLITGGVASDGDEARALLDVIATGPRGSALLSELFARSATHAPLVTRAAPREAEAPASSALVAPSTRPATRAEIATSLGDVRTRDRLAVARLHDTLRTAIDDETIAAAAEALATLGRTDAVDEMVASLHRPVSSPASRRAARTARAIERLVGPAGLDARITRLARSHDERDRSAAVAALEAGATTRGLEQLANLVDDTSPSVAASALEALEALAARDGFVDAAPTADAGWRERGGDALAGALLRRALDRRRVLDVLARSPFERRPAIQRLAQILWLDSRVTHADSDATRVPQRVPPLRMDAGAAADGLHRLLPASMADAALMLLGAPRALLADPAATLDRTRVRAIAWVLPEPVASRAWAWLLANKPPAAQQ